MEYVCSGAKLLFTMEEPEESASISTKVFPGSTDEASAPLLSEHFDTVHNIKQSCVKMISKPKLAVKSPL